jgi:predicted dehydrogenase
MSKVLRIGMVGLDTSHVSAFTQLLNNSKSEYYVPGGEVVVAYPGGSLDFAKSYSRIEGFTNELRDKYGVQIVDSLESVAEQCDVIMLESVDGRVHLEQFKKIAPFGKPIFIDKPFATTLSDAQEMVDLARKYELPIMSCSALRFAEGLISALHNTEKGEITGADCYGPLELEPTQPGMFWYGVHTSDMLYNILGKGCVQVSATTNADHDVIVGEWADGRIGTIRGNRNGNSTFGGIIHRKNGSDYMDVYANKKPYYACLLEQVMSMFITGKPSIDPEETLEIIRFMEAVNESRQTGMTVKL